MHERNFVVQDTVQRHNQVVGLLCELLSCFSSWTSSSTKSDVAEMLKGARWRDDGGLSFCGVEHQAQRMRLTSADMWGFTDYQAGDEGEPIGLEDVVYMIGLPEPHTVTLSDVTASLAAVKLGNSGHAARAA
jgi:hypothetical protein